MTSIELMLKWGIRMDLLAGRIGMSKQCFNNKLKGRNKFQEIELENLKKVLVKELAKDIKEVK